jgi:hypothetical protein
VANEAARAIATRAGVTFAGGRIDALVRCEGVVLSTRESEVTLFGVAQVRRLLSTRSVSLAHVVFAPASPRALLLGLVRVQNRTSEPLAIEYTEMWDVAAGEYRIANGACERRFGGHVFALAEASTATRAHAPEAAPSRGLALDVALAVPPRARRHLSFAYLALPEEEDAGECVRAWRGGVAGELERIGASGLDVAAYRALGRYSRPR